MPTLAHIAPQHTHIHAPTSAMAHLQTPAGDAAPSGSGGGGPVGPESASRGGAAGGDHRRLSAGEVGASGAAPPTPLHEAGQTLTFDDGDGDGDGGGGGGAGPGDDGVGPATATDAGGATALYTHEPARVEPAGPRVVAVEDLRPRLSPRVRAKRRARKREEKKEMQWNGRHHVTASRNNAKNTVFFRELFDKLPWENDVNRMSLFRREDNEEPEMRGPAPPRVDVIDRVSPRHSPRESRRKLRARVAEQASLVIAERRWDARFQVQLTNDHAHHAYREFFDRPRVFDDRTRPRMPRSIDGVDDLVAPPPPPTGPAGHGAISDPTSVVGNLYADAVSHGRYVVDNKHRLVPVDPGRSRPNTSPRRLHATSKVSDKPLYSPRDSATAMEKLQPDEARDLGLRPENTADRRERGWNSRSCLETVAIPGVPLARLRLNFKARDASPDYVTRVARGGRAGSRSGSRAGSRGGGGSAAGALMVPSRPNPGGYSGSQSERSSSQWRGMAAHGLSPRTAALPNGATPWR